MVMISTVQTACITVGVGEVPEVRPGPDGGAVQVCLPGSPAPHRDSQSAAGGRAEVAVGGPGVHKHQVQRRAVRGRPHEVTINLN